ncbi:HNH endonuclease [Kribbella alba]
MIERIEAGSVYYTESGCLEWIQGCTPAGYGLMWLGDRKQDYVHRVMLKAHGRDLDGLTVDHLCERKACSNPKHLDVVTREENTRRMRDKNWQAHLVTIRPSLGLYERLADRAAC